MNRRKLGAVVAAAALAAGGVGALAHDQRADGGVGPVRASSTSRASAKNMKITAIQSQNSVISARYGA
jgi:hypothetical protein